MVLVLAQQAEMVMAQQAERVMAQQVKKEKIRTGKRFLTFRT